MAQTMSTACYKIVGFAGYGSYLTALSYPVYLQLGGVPKGQPGYDPGTRRHMGACGRVHVVHAWCSTV